MSERKGKKLSERKGDEKAEGEREREREREREEIESWLASK